MGNAKAIARRARGKGQRSGQAKQCGMRGAGEGEGKQHTEAKPAAATTWVLSFSRNRPSGARGEQSGG